MDGVSWGQLPAPTAETKAFCAKLPSGLPFKGDISHAYTIPADPLPEGGAGDALPSLSGDLVAIVA